VILIDGDILAYRVAWSCNDEPLPRACSTLDNYIADILCTIDGEEDDYIVFLSGDSADNFRHEYAVSAPYKGNREEAEKPVHLSDMFGHLITKWAAKVAVNEEADDAIAIQATLYGDDAVIVSIDKDFDQVPGWHYNFVKQRKYYVEPEDAMLFFYGQILTGDRIDNIIGIQGVGPVKAYEALAEVEETELNLYNVCVEQYMEETDEMTREVAEDLVIENARLLWLRRTEGQIWMPPTGDITKEEPPQ
jgi:5'-3' exonuclease